MFRPLIIDYGYKVPLNFNGAVTSVFNKACNVTITNNEIVTLLADNSGKSRRYIAPSGINLDISPYSSWQEICFIDMPIYNHNGLISSTAFCFNLRQVKPWQASAFSTRTTPEIILANYDLIKSLVNKHAQQYLLNDDFHQATITAIYHNFNSPEQVSTWVKNNLGRGIGLTPAMDDFLVGLLLGLQVLVETPQQQSFLYHLSNTILQNLTLTTPISAQYLQQAVSGDFVSLLIDFRNVALACVNLEQLLNYTQQILTIGASSGFDTLNGFILALQLVLIND